MYDVVQVLGSLMILAPFVAVLLGGLTPDTYRYLAANALGSAVLAVIAVIGREWGFLLLEAVWALASTYSLLRKASGRPAISTH
jgi:hypothetical protein